jgi:hypothetical protein
LRTEIVRDEVVVYYMEIRKRAVFLHHFFVKMLTELDGVVVASGGENRIGSLARAGTELENRFALADLCVFYQRVEKLGGVSRAVFVKFFGNCVEYFSEFHANTSANSNLSHSFYHRIKKAANNTNQYRLLLFMKDHRFLHAAHA